MLPKRGHSPYLSANKSNTPAAIKKSRGECGQAHCKSISFSVLGIFIVSMCIYECINHDGTIKCPLF